jgi:hypothetical protein
MGSKNNRCWFQRKATQAVATQVGRGVRIQGGQFQFLRVSYIYMAHGGGHCQMTTVKLAND